MECDFIATGHYAQVRNENGRYVVSKGLDSTKDQSYVLWGISQENLAMSRFPLGGFHKKDIRKMCEDWGYTELAKKSESYEICFVPDNDYRGFLKRRVPELEEKVAGGKFVDQHGNVIGTHEGYPFYTIGQRKGLGVAFGAPKFVTDIDAETNTVVLGNEEDLNRSGMVVGKINLQKYAAIEDGMEAITKVRYKDSGTPCKLFNYDGGKIRVEFDREVKAIAPGQSAVFYEGNDVIGGGNIFSGYKLPTNI
jgi:tRNA-specific 2-thiouridylase